MIYGLIERARRQFDDHRYIIACHCSLLTVVVVKTSPILLLLCRRLRKRVDWEGGGGGGRDILAFFISMTFGFISNKVAKDT